SSRSGNRGADPRLRRNASSTWALRDGVCGYACSVLDLGRAKMMPMLRPATPADRLDVIALALAEDAAWSDEPEVSGEEIGELIAHYGPGVIFERGGLAAGYAAVGEGGGTILLADPGDPEPALEALVAWLGDRAHPEIDTYAGDARRIAWL